jgi:branched-chain amino acid transport system permease protein
MNCSPRHILIGILGILAITAPFIWFHLDYQPQTQTVQLEPALAKGLIFFRGLIPVFIVLTLFIAWQRCSKYIPLPPALKAIGHGLSRFKYHTYFPLALGLLLILASFVLDAKSLSLGVFMGLFMLQALGLNITTGMTGLLVLGYAGFFAYGGYVFALAQILIPGLPWWSAMPVVFLLGAVIGGLVGLPCLRLRGDYLAIVTLGFAESFRELMRNLEITGGNKGISLNSDSKIQGFLGISSLQSSFLIILGMVAVSVFVIHRLYHSAIGRAWIAIREDEIAASAMGIPVVRMKLLAFALSAAFAALAGQLYVCYVGFIDPAACAFEQSVLVLAMVILGGMGSIPGVLLGSALLYLIPALLRDQFPAISDYRLLLFGSIMVVMMLYRPQGLLGSKRHQLELKPGT